jgi:glyoxylase-like metal-dependent hydrolase (beta-lactamase superfamily II)
MTSSVGIAIGDVYLVALSEGIVFNSPEDVVPGHSTAELQRDHPDLVGFDGAVQLDLACYLVKTPEKTILVDSGVGPRLRSEYQRGYLDLQLQRIGISPSDIDIVALTHLHDDHVGWNTIDDSTGAPVPFFPNAAYLIQRSEWDYWAARSELADEENEYLRQCVIPLAATGQLQLIESPGLISGPVSCFSTSGHTPGHVSIRIESSGETAIIAGDATHYPAQLNYPTWSTIWDSDGVAAAATRKALFDELADDPHAYLIAGHWPFPGVGQIVTRDGKRIFRPAFTEPSVAQHTLLTAGGHPESLAQ